MLSSKRFPTRRKLFQMSLFSSFVGLFSKAVAQELRFPEIAAFRDRVIEIASRQPGFVSATASTHDPAKFDWQVGSWTTTSDVTNIFGYLNSYPDEDADKIIERFVVDAITAASSNANDENIVAVIRTTTAIDQLKNEGLQPIYRKLVDGLAVTLMSDSPGALTWVMVDDFPGRSFEQLEPIALRNLRGWMPKVLVDGPTDQLAQYIVKGNESLSPGLILLEEFWERVRSDFPGDVLVVVARQDQLFVIDAANPSGVGLARRLVDATFEDGFGLLSDRIYRKRDGKLELVEE